MSHPLRIEYKDAIYHVMNRGRRREDIFLDDGDRNLFLSVFAEAVKLFHVMRSIYSSKSDKGRIRTRDWYI